MIQTPTASGMDGIKLQTPPLPLPLKGGELPTEFPLRQQFFGGQGGAIPMWRTRRRNSHVADKAAADPLPSRGGAGVGSLSSTYCHATLIAFPLKKLSSVVNVVLKVTKDNLNN